MITVLIFTNTHRGTNELNIGASELFITGIEDEEISFDNLSADEALIWSALHRIKDFEPDKFYEIKLERVFEEGLAVDGNYIMSFKVISKSIAEFELPF